MKRKILILTIKFIKFLCVSIFVISLTILAWHAYATHKKYLKLEYLGEINTNILAPEQKVGLRKYFEDKKLPLQITEGLEAKEFEKTINFILPKNDYLKANIVISQNRKIDKLFYYKNKPTLFDEIKFGEVRYEKNHNDSTFYMYRLYNKIYIKN